MDNNDNVNLADAVLQERLVEALIQQQGVGGGADNNNSNDDPSMRLSQQERELAIQIKAAVEASTELHNLPDMEYAHHALVTPTGNLQEALQKIQGIQTFREHYRIDNTIEQGVFYLQESLKQQPGYLLHMDLEETTYEPIFVLDMGAFFPGRAMEVSPTKGAEFNFEVDICKNYYAHWVLCPTLSSIRGGIFGIIDCYNVGWSNFNTEYANRYHSELWGCLPVNWKSILCYNTAPLANICFSLMKPLMDESMQQSLQLGLQLHCLDDAGVPSRQLRELYLQPTMEAAHDKIVTKFQELMTRRLQNEQQFRL